MPNALDKFLVENCKATGSAPFVCFNENSTCLGQTRELNDTSLLEYIDKVNITNTSITFDDSGGVLGSYEICNYQATFSYTGDINGYKYVTVGTWLSGKLTIVNGTDMQFGLKSDGSLRREPMVDAGQACTLKIFQDRAVLSASLV